MKDILIVIVGVFLVLFLFSQGLISWEYHEFYELITVDRQRATTKIIYGFLIEAFNEQGIKAYAGRNLKGSIFDAPQQSINVNGNPIYIYKFPNSALLQEELKRISPDGCSVGKCESRLSLGYKAAAGHYFKNSNTLFHYLGGEEDVLKVLETVLGPPFAGDRFRSEK